MKRHLLGIVTLLGMCAIISMQSVWLLLTYSLVRNEFRINTTNMLDMAINKATFATLYTLPSGTGVESKKPEDNNNIPDYAYIQESLIKLGYDMSMEKLYDIYKNLIEESYPNSKFKLYKIKSENDSVFQVTGENIDASLSLQTTPVPIRTDYSLFIQAEFTNPQQLLFSRMGLLLVSTVIMMIFVIGCIIYQIRIISNQNKIAQVREDFSNSMVHDMKNPLSSIMMCTKFLHSGKLDDKPELKEEYFQIIENESDHLLKLADKILGISKLENKKLKIQPETIELKPVFDNLINNFTAKTPKPLDFILNLKEEFIYADREYIPEVFDNLIDNAIKYSKERVAIKITSERNENYSIIKFHDNGIGISEKDKKNIFNKFERGSAVKRAKSGGPSGFGLGLNYVYQVVKAHHGNIVVNSMENEFTEFIIYIPLEIKKL